MTNQDYRIVNDVDEIGPVGIIWQGDKIIGSIRQSHAYEQQQPLNLRDQKQGPWFSQETRDFVVRGYREEANYLDCPEDDFGQTVYVSHIGASSATIISVPTETISTIPFTEALRRTCARVMGVPVEELTDEDFDGWMAERAARVIS